jgi:hypothetical protein
MSTWIAFGLASLAFVAAVIAVVCFSVAFDTAVKAGDEFAVHQARSGYRIAMITGAVALGSIAAISMAAQ